ncbi:hypothetical protein D9M68_914970 [compost metagenome]
MYICPSSTAATASNNSSQGLPLSKNPVAPASSALSAESMLEKAVKMTMRVCGAAAVIWAIVRKISPGMLRSITMTSGRFSRTRSKAELAHSARPTTS